MQAVDTDVEEAAIPLTLDPVAAFSTTRSNVHVRGVSGGQTSPSQAELKRNLTCGFSSGVGSARMNFRVRMLVIRQIDKEGKRVNGVTNGGLSRGSCVVFFHFRYS